MIAAAPPGSDPGRLANRIESVLEGVWFGGGALGMAVALRVATGRGRIAP
jgi:hypothetical protein